MQDNPTDENVAADKKARAEFTKVKLQQLRNIWHEKPQSINMETDSYKLWHIARSINDDRPEKKQTVIEVNGELLTGKLAANTFAVTYQKDRTLTLPTERTKAVQEQIRQSKLNNQQLHVIRQWHG